MTKLNTRPPAATAVALLVGVVAAGRLDAYVEVDGPLSSSIRTGLSGFSFAVTALVLGVAVAAVVFAVRWVRHRPNQRA